jgi:hypothetical protein
MKGYRKLIVVMTVIIGAFVSLWFFGLSGDNCVSVISTVTAAFFLANSGQAVGEKIAAAKAKSQEVKP